MLTMHDATLGDLPALSRRTRDLVATSRWTALLAGLSALATVGQTRVIHRASVTAVDPMLLPAVRMADWLALFTGAALVLASIVGVIRWALWTRDAFALGSSLGLRSLRTRGASAAWSFVIPLVQLWRPFLVLVELTRALDRERIPAGAPVASQEATEHYRQNAVGAAVDDRPLPSVPIGAWWALWLGGWALTRVAAFTHDGARTLVDLRTSLTIDLFAALALAAAALLAARVAVGLDARLRERAARVGGAR
jgi:hypothetical protein